MFNYMQEPQRAITVPKTKHPKTRSKKNTEKKSKFNHTKRKTQIIQPGGRAKSNRWTEHGTAVVADTYIAHDSNSHYIETVKKQRIPNVETWLTKLHTISCVKNVQYW